MLHEFGTIKRSALFVILVKLSLNKEPSNFVKQEKSTKSLKVNEYKLINLLVNFDSVILLF